MIPESQCCVVIYSYYCNITIILRLNVCICKSVRARVCEYI